MLQLGLLRKDHYRREISKQAIDIDSLKAFAEDVLKGIDTVDLKSYSFERDPDLKTITL